MGMGRVAALIASALVIMGFALLPHVAHSRDGVNDFAWRLLAAHNAERTRFHAPPLWWSAKLAHDAQGWAEQLAARGKMEHSTNEQRGGEGENLWMGSAGRYQAEDMVGAFVAERAAFRPGKFPQVSRTGNWADVGHYTQLVWPGTQELGCAVAKGARDDFLVCRYWPAGNMVGETIG